jgi:hypothetical protein
MQELTHQGLSNGPTMWQEMCLFNSYDNLVEFLYNIPNHLH